MGGLVWLNTLPFLNNLIFFVHAPTLIARWLYSLSPMWASRSFVQYSNPLNQLSSNRNSFSSIKVIWPPHYLLCNLQRCEVFKYILRSLKHFSFASFDGWSCSVVSFNQFEVTLFAQVMCIIDMFWWKLTVISDHPGPSERWYRSKSRSWERATRTFYCGSCPDKFPFLVFSLELKKMCAIAVLCVTMLQKAFSDEVISQKCFQLVRML